MSFLGRRKHGEECQVKKQETFVMFPQVPFAYDSSPKTYLKFFCLQSSILKKIPLLKFVCDHYETRVMLLEDKSIFNSKYVSNTDHLKFVSIFSKPSQVSQELVCYKVKADQSEEKTRKVCWYVSLHSCQDTLLSLLFGMFGY